MPEPAPERTGFEIAIVGMACRFPGAPDLDAFWRNLRDGVDALAALDPEALRARDVEVLYLTELLTETLQDEIARNCNLEAKKLVA